MAKATSKKKDLDASAEEKIMAAARVVFTRNGYAATTVRDIAAEADLNFSLVNYYFRSKEKLFELIMLDAIKQLLSGLKDLLNDTHTSAMEKIDAVCPKYMDMLLAHPDLPLFVMTGIANNAISSPEISKALIDNNIFLQSYFLKQLQELYNKNKLAIEPLHLVMNMMSMLTLPFIARTMLLRSGTVDMKMFRQMMEDRKQKIPIWLKAMM
ncbi:TetR/AcrR family transcriptional regulator [Chitinophaga sp. Cy-1792]|uniref:TetR/AcrR family transcriptional regulator n=1 Tax=Chitinophaga sp. Cy-1792 TaxID=2608339 RepID=UPI001420D18A|nr:TetR family transcriptional regulator [Chitinophaga sp. Cy-1792]NIG56018.1 TetR/AcrR family transcriptional regulator [Chitinophaga sp. Cy-1792]